MDNNKASMDNKAYLDQIAVKGKVKSGPIFTPMLIKLIAAGVVMLITMIIVGSVISIGTTGVKTSGISAEVTKAENANMSAYTSALENAILSGTLDRVFATETLYQISTLIQYENESLKKANSQSYANLIKQSIQDLTTLEENFNTWSETH